jgi:hypothetical protein
MSSKKRTASSRRPLPAPVRAPSPRTAKSLFARTEVAETAKPNPASAAVVSDPREKVLSPEQLPKPVARDSKAQTSGSHPQHNLNVPQLRQSFASQAPSRSQWTESEYVSLIKRLDALQTEAFLLKGKLLAEAKDRFFAENNKGWIAFCDDSLGLNYTTANQYIRVALECDVMSHQYPSLGFEHFKALLPVAESERIKILSKFSGGSVKALRQMVATTLLQSGQDARKGAHALGQPALDRDAMTKAARLLLRHLQSVHQSLESLDLDSLPPRLAWQVTVACGQVATQLNRTARSGAPSDESLEGALVS